MRENQLANTKLWLPCPCCDAPAIPPTRMKKGEPWWVTRGEEHLCERCGEAMVVEIEDKVAWATWKPRPAPRLLLATSATRATSATTR